MSGNEAISTSITRIFLFSWVPAFSSNNTLMSDPEVRPTLQHLHLHTLAASFRISAKTKLRQVLCGFSSDSCYILTILVRSRHCCVGYARENPAANKDRRYCSYCTKFEPFPVQYCGIVAKKYIYLLQLDFCYI